MNELQLSVVAAGVLVPVHAHAGARKNQVSGIHDGRLKVSVTQAPEQGKANQAIQKVLAEFFEIPRSRISLTSGPTASRKIFCLSGADIDEVRQRCLSIIP